MANLSIIRSIFYPMLHPNERPHQDLQKRFLVENCILQIHYYLGYTSFTAETLLGFFAPLMVLFKVLYVDVEIGDIEKSRNLYFHKHLIQASSAAYFKISVMALYI